MGVTYNDNDTTHITNLSGSSVAANSSVTCLLDLSTVDGGILSVSVTSGGTVTSGAAGLQVGVLAAENSGADVDTAQTIVGVVPVVATATTTRRSFRLPTGKYTVVLTNLDQSNGVTTAIPVLATWVK